MRRVGPFIVLFVLAGSAAAAERLPHRVLPLGAGALSANATASVAPLDAPRMQEMVAPEPDILVVHIDASGERTVACVHGAAAHRAFMDQGQKQRIADESGNH
jgi:hypothetical protein